MKIWILSADENFQTIKWLYWFEISFKPKFAGILKNKQKSMQKNVPKINTKITKICLKNNEEKIFFKYRRDENVMTS